MKRIKLADILKESEEGSKKFSTDAKKNFLEIVSTYNKYQEMMDRKSDITKVAETLGAITEAATQLAISEGDDWFDKHTVKRNMGELKKLGGQFDKISRESAVLDQRLTGLYEDMGHILSRYYKIGEITEDEMKSRLGMNTSSVNEGISNNDIPNDIWDTPDDFEDWVNMGMKSTKGKSISIKKSDNKKLQQSLENWIYSRDDGRAGGDDQSDVYIDIIQKILRKGTLSESKVNEEKESDFIVFWKGKQHNVKGTSLYDAKKKAIVQLKVPKSKQASLNIVSQKSQDAGDFRFN